MRKNRNIFLLTGGLLSIAVISFFVPGCVAQSSLTNELSLTKIACSVEFVRNNGNAEFSKVSVTYKNNSKGVFKTPAPLGEKETAEPESMLLILVKINSTDTEEEFGYTIVDAQSQQEHKQVAIAPGESKTVDYFLSNFWRWSSSGPDKWGDFTKYLQPGTGTNEVEARVAVIMKDVKSESKSQKLFCSFPDWLFKPRQ